MTALSHLFAWFSLLMPWGTPESVAGPQIQPCSSPVEQVCMPPAQQAQQERDKPGPLRQMWENRRYGISNGI